MRSTGRYARLAVAAVAGSALGGTLAFQSAGALGDRDCQAAYDSVRWEHSEAPGVQRAAAKAYVRDFHVSLRVAYSRLRIQDATSSLDFQSTIDRFHWADEWYVARDCGRLHIGVVGAGNPPHGEAVARALRLINRARVSRVVRLVWERWSEAELIRGQDVVDRMVAALIRHGKVSTGLDPSRNSVIVETASSVTVRDLAAVKRAVRSARVRVVIERTRTRSVGITLS